VRDDALVLRGKFELVGRVDLGVELIVSVGGPVRKRLRAIAALAGALDLQRARQRVGDCTAGRMMPFGRMANEFGSSRTARLSGCAVSREAGHDYVITTFTSAG